MNLVASNWVALLVAAAVSMAVGGFWYSPMLFGKVWMRLSGITEAHLSEMKKKGMGKSYLAQFASSFVMTFVLSVFIKTFQTVAPGAPAWQNAVMVALWAWLGFVATVTLGCVLWEGRPLKLYFLNAGHYLIMMIVISLILSLWP